MISVGNIKTIFKRLKLGYLYTITLRDSKITEEKSKYDKDGLQFKD